MPFAPIRGAANSRHTYGNEEGRTILSDLKELKACSQRLEERMTKKEGETRDLQARVRLLTQNSGGYLGVRERFLEQNSTSDTHTQASGHIVRRDGNEAAHTGDAITDAYVYTSGRRMDTDLSTLLYDVSHKTVVDLGNEGQYGHIAVLNTMASLRSRLREGQVTSISQGIERAFANFISRLGDKDQTRVTSAISEFWKQYYSTAE